MNFFTDGRLTGCLLVTQLLVNAELRRRPELISRPLIITSGDTARPVVLAASAEATGVTAGQTVASALSRCQGAVTLPVDAGYLSAVNDAVLAALWDVVPAVEAVGWGVIYLDLTGLADIYGGMAGLCAAVGERGLAAAPPGHRDGQVPSLLRGGTSGDQRGGGWFPPTRPGSWRLCQHGGCPWTPMELAGWMASASERRATWRDCRSHRWRSSWGRMGSGPGLAQGVDPAPVFPTSLPEQPKERLEFPFPVDTVPAI